MSEQTQRPNDDAAVNETAETPATTEAGTNVDDGGGGAQTQMQRPAAETPATTTAADAVAATGKVSPMQIEPLVLQDLATQENSMVQMLSQRPDAEKWLTEARELAEKVELEDPKALLEYGAEGRDTIGSIADDMIGDRTMGDSGDISKLFSELSDVSKELAIEKVNAPKSLIQKLFGWMPWGIGKRLQPMYQFVERFQKIRPKIDAKEDRLRKIESERTQARQELLALKEQILNGFLSIEVAVAAGEIALEREIRLFEEARKELEGSQDLVALQKLKDRRLAITNLDNRLMRLQVSRMDAVKNLAVIDQTADVQMKLKSTVEDLRTITIKEIRTGAAIALNIYDARAAAALAGGVQELNNALRKANVEALDMLQTETHEIATAGAREAKQLEEIFERFNQVLSNGNNLLRENERMNREARETLVNVDKKFRADVQTHLQDLAADRIGEGAPKQDESTTDESAKG